MKRFGSIVLIGLGMPAIFAMTIHAMDYLNVLNRDFITPFCYALILISAGGLSIGCLGLAKGLWDK